MNFMKGIVILTVLLISVITSFFMGRILGAELMEDGKEKLGSFSATGDGPDPGHPALAGLGLQAYNYQGPTADRFPATYVSEPIDNSDSEGSIILIEPVDGGSATVESDPTDIFGLDTGRRFRIQIMVYSKKENADNLVADLVKESYPAFTVETKSEDGDPRWKVFVGPYPSREAAHLIAEELRKGNHRAYVSN